MFASPRGIVFRDMKGFAVGRGRMAPGMGEREDWNVRIDDDRSGNDRNEPGRRSSRPGPDDSETNDEDDASS
jgi:hypothetical protein